MLEIIICKNVTFWYRCCESNSKTVHEVSTVFYNSSDAANSTFCLNRENNLSKSKSINCEENAQILELNQYDLYNINGVGVVSSKLKFSKANSEFRFDISSEDYCVSIRFPDIQKYSCHFL